MSGFIHGICRSQSTLLPERIDDYVSEDNPVRVIDVFVDSLDLKDLAFKIESAATGRPGYHPSTLLKLYIYGYLNRIQSSRRLESETQRNVELMWLLEKLAPDFKTIADFRKDNGKGIQKICREFVVLCRKLKLLTDFVAIDGSKFKGVNNVDRNFTQNKVKARLKRLDASIHGYLTDLAHADLHDSKTRNEQKKNIEHKLARVRSEVEKLNQVSNTLTQGEVTQISLTDPDSRSMKSKDMGFVGYNVQSAVDTNNHLIVAHEVTNNGSDRNALKDTAVLAKQVLEVDQLKVVADRGYFNSTQILECERQNIETCIPKSMTSNNRSKGQFDKNAFLWIETDQEYQCPAGKRLTHRTTMTDRGLTYHRYWTSGCGNCPLKARCTDGKERRVT